MKRYTVTRRFLTGPLTGLTHTEETSVPFTVGEQYRATVGDDYEIVECIARGAWVRVGQPHYATAAAAKGYLTRNWTGPSCPDRDEWEVHVVPDRNRWGAELRQSLFGERLALLMRSLPPGRFVTAEMADALKVAS
jgi:hypothetical protein